MFPRIWLVAAFTFTTTPGTGVAAAFPEPFNSERAATKPLSAEDAVRQWKLPDGFTISVVAAEPDLRQPIAHTFDAGGRLWVAENYTYAEAGVNFATDLRDRIVIFNDADGGGRPEDRRVFWDEATRLSSIELGAGGVFALCPPRLLFLPDRNRDDQPDGPPEVLLDGFDLTDGNRHNLANGLKWGPDGWLWGRVGLANEIRPGTPGAPRDARPVMRGGIWRYHPGRRVFEVVCHGTTNPWGLDWTELGEPFFINTVIGHLWHAIPGAHLDRMFGDDVNPRAYGLIAQHADHFHFDTGRGWMASRPKENALDAGNDSLGGGHAHSGLWIVSGAGWPASLRGRVLTINFHGRRLNVDRLERHGSGFVGRHEPDMAFSADPWFRGLDLVPGPDGAVYISDWSDAGECHDHDGVHRSSGRLYRLSPPGLGPPRRPRDLQGASPDELVAAILGQNVWAQRQAQRVLADRHLQGTDLSAASGILRREFDRASETPVRLRLLWALRAIGAASEEFLVARLADPDEAMRSWAIRLLAEDLPVKSAVRNRWAEMARADSSGLVRLYLASALQRLTYPDREALGAALLSRAEDDGDHNLPFMLWYGLEPLVGTQPDAGVALARSSRIRWVRQSIAHRLAEEIATQPSPLDALLAWAAQVDASAQTDVIRGLGDALRGVRRAPAPKDWSARAAMFSTHPDAAIRDRVRELSLVFGDGRALDDLRRVVADGKADASARKKAIQALLDGGAADVAPLLRPLVQDANVRLAAILGLLRLGDAAGPMEAIGKYRWIDVPERGAVLAAMTARPESARVLIEAVGANRIPRADITPVLARQIRSLGDEGLRAELEKHWGIMGASDPDKRATIGRLRAELTPDALRPADLSQGRAQFVRLCAGCHQLYGEGGRVGPDLTGSGRADIGYLLENLVDPSAVVASDYRMTVVELKDGRTLNGLLRDPNPRTVTLVTQSETATLDRSEIVRIETAAQSMMPEGLLESLEPAQRRDLIAYLMHPRQVPQP
jgi:putative membrane-bound dehydrogenase-like protein